MLSLIVAHVYGLVAAVLLSAFVGNYVVAMKQFEFVPYLERCAEIGATCLKLVPATAVRMAKDSVLQKLDLTSVQFVSCSGAALSSEIVDKLQALLKGAAITNGYGMSETTVTFLRENWGVSKAGSVGRPASGVSIRLVDEKYNDVKPGEPGECLIKSETMFMGYKNNDSETKSSFKNGWLCSGDVLKVDEDGFFWLTGRKKELIKYKGNQVAPAELEDVLLSHPLVTDAAVCGIYDEKQETELPVGYVSLQESVAIEEREKVLKEIREYVHVRVSPYKKLRGGLYYLKQMPKGTTGKLQRLELPAKVVERRKTASLTKL